jgi:long-chain acyl-CoA synthetase
VAPPVWVFDVDGTILDSLTGTSLRPGVDELLRRLRAEGCRVLLWSAGGAGYARDRASQHGIDGLFDGFFDKDQRDAQGRYVPTFLATPLAATYVDDRPEDMPIGAAIIPVSPYLVDDRFDRGLERALAEG